MLDALLSAHTTPGSVAQAITDILADTAAMQPLVDAAISSRSSHSAADVDTTLTGTHGAGSWQTATGFATPGDAMALTVAAIDAIWDELQAGHTTPGSFGLFLDAAISSISVAPGPIADAVWEELINDHEATVGSAAWYMLYMGAVAFGDSRIVNQGVGSAAQWVETHDHPVSSVGTSDIVQLNLRGLGNPGAAISDANNPFADSGLNATAGFMDRVRTVPA